MKITILTPNFASNSLGRAYILAEMLKKKHEVEIVGPLFQGSTVWKPLSRINGINFKIIETEKLPFFLKPIPSFLRFITGDVIYAIKPVPTSFGIALLKRIGEKLPIVLDIDDWELGGWLDLSWEGRLKKTILDINNPSTFYPLVKLTYSLFKIADQITVSSSFLKKRYGGTIIVHARDTDKFNPHNYDAGKIKNELKIEGKVVLFSGTPRSHKGLSDLINAIKKIDRKDICLMIVGVNDNNLRNELLNETVNIKVYGFQPFDELAKFISMADVVVIPQRKTNFSDAQVPAKLFDAMSMAKPIISTSVSDIPEILSNGTGIIVEPGNINQLAVAIEWVLDNEDKALEIGLNARRRCIDKYSLQNVGKNLIQLFKKYENPPSDEI